MTFTIKEKVHDIDLVVEDIRQAPQTYSTILQEQAFNATLLFILRRKLNSLCKKGVVMKANIPGTRCGRVILYMLPKKYTIVVESSRVGVNVYYYFTSTKIDNYRIKITEYWELEDGDWKHRKNDLILFEGKILKII